MKYALSLASAASMLIATSQMPEAKAQQATIGSYGCGTGCIVNIKQLSPAIRIGNGSSKVLVEETTRFFDPEGKPDGTRKSKFWEFAKCNGNLYGKGFRSDGADAEARSIYDEGGRPIDYNAGGQIFLKWKTLCNAPQGPQ